MNPYTSSGSVATMTANVSGNDNLNDLGDGPRQPGDPERYPVGAVTRRLLGYVRPHRISFTASFVSAAISVILQLYTPILIGEGIDLIVAAGQVDFDALLPLVTKLAIVVVGAAAFQWLQATASTACPTRQCATCVWRRATSSAACRSALSTAMPMVTL